MAIISNTTTVTGEISKTWQIPPEPGFSNSNIPRGIFTFDGTKAVAAKLAADQTRFRLLLNFTAPFCYLLRSVAIEYRSDDDVNDFLPIADCNYVLGGLNNEPHFQMLSEGVGRTGGTLTASQSYRLLDNYPRLFIDGRTDDLRFNFADISTDASTAGDFFFHAEFWIYDKEQCNRHAVHTPFLTAPVA